MKISDLIDSSPSPVATMERDRSVDDAIETLQSNNVRALIVTDQGRPVGIFSERDVLRAYRNHRSTPFDHLPLKDVMTPKLISVEANQDLKSTMDMMVKTDIHHLPVIEDGNLKAMLTLYDLIKLRVRALEQEVHHLKDYISDLHDAGLD